MEIFFWKSVNLINSVIRLTMARKDYASILLKASKLAYNKKVIEEIEV